MKDITSMAVVMRDRERPSPKVWQPWYMEEGEGGGGKELPSRAQREQRARERVTVPRPPMHRASPSPECSSEDDEINVVDSPPPMSTHAHGYYAHPAHMDDEAPLDMTTKRRSSPTPTRLTTHTTNSPSPPPYHPRPNFLPRPSVITCVPPKYAHMPPHAHREIPPSYTERPLPPPYSVATAHLSQQRGRDCTPMLRPVVTAHARTTEDNLLPPLARRQVVQAGPVDPEIDEHFRRSLGRDYHHLFSAATGKTAPSTDSVDDHFAKALGETWTKLQAERKDGSAGNSTSTRSSSSSSSTTSSSALSGGGVVDIVTSVSTSTPSTSSSSSSTTPPRLIST